jgi:eukaryotic-like serine/threonine-protein kinase
VIAPSTVIRRIAIGGTCELDLIEAADHRRWVRKRPLASVPPKVRERLLAEGQLLATIDSPHVVKVGPIAEQEIWLEPIEGIDLDQLGNQLRRRGEQLSTLAVWTIVRGIAQGLIAIHAQSKVHADLGPANVMLAADGRIVLIDLGLARGFGEAPPIDREGTLAYQPPEQLRGQGIDVRADLYAAGLIAYELLTGVLARPAGMIGAKELLEARRTLPLAPSTIRPEIGSVADEVVLWAIQPQASARPASVEAWLARLPKGGPASELRGLLEKGARAVIPQAMTAAAPSAQATLVEPESPTLLIPPKEEPPKKRRSSWLWWAAALPIAIALGWWRLAESPAPVTAPIAEPVIARASPPPPSPPPWTAPPSTPTIVPRPIVDPPPPPTEPIRELKEPKAATRVLVRGDVRVVSGEHSGPAPWTSNKLGSSPTIIEISKGEVRALVRIEPSGSGHGVTIGAPPGTYYQAECGGQPARSTPLIGLQLGSFLGCKLAREDGQSLRFELKKLGD